MQRIVSCVVITIALAYIGATSLGSVIGGQADYVAGPEELIFFIIFSIGCLLGSFYVLMKKLPKVIETETEKLP